ncbi:MAG: BlaI/MecI/CopY family transcriptional regulator [Saccharofermentanales bacterium]
MTHLKKLPNAELEIMKAVWECKSTITSGAIMSLLNNNTWKPQTILTLLGRLVDRGFLKTEKHNKERIYLPIVSEEEYLKFETDNFLNIFHHNSLPSLVNTLYQGRKISDDDLSELLKWIKERSD